MPQVSKEDRTNKIQKLFDGMKGFQLAIYDRQVLQKTLTVAVDDDAKLAEYGLSLLDKFPTHHWNQA